MPTCVFSVIFGPFIIYWAGSFFVSDSGSFGRLFNVYIWRSCPLHVQKSNLKTVTLLYLLMAHKDITCWSPHLHRLVCSCIQVLHVRSGNQANTGQSFPSSDRRTVDKQNSVRKALMRREAGARFRACTLTEACLQDMKLPASSSSAPGGRLRLRGFFYLQECVSHVTPSG